MKLQRIFLMSLSLSLISGCSVFQDKKELSNFTDEVIVIDTLKPEKPEKVLMKEVNFIVITEDNIDEINLLVKEGVSFVSLTSKGYENLSLNIAELKRYLEQQKEIVIYYESQ